MKVLSVTDLSGVEERNLGLAIERGGCGIMAACQKFKFVHLAAAC